jgi:hypothetical protein
MVALAVLTPSLASGNARTDIGTGAAAAAVARPFVATLIGGAEEVPTPGDPDGAGQAAVTIDRASGEVCWDLRVSNVSTVTMAHIHRGVRGQAGPVVVDFSSALPNPTSAGCTTVAPALATEIATNPSGFYVNVHTTEFGGGAVRGQLAVSTSTSGQTRLLASPLRAYDSRVGTVGKMRVGETRTIDLATGVDSAGAITLAVPPGATGAVVRIAVDDTVSAGFLKAYSAALTAAPPTAVLNWYEARAIVGAESIVAVNTLGQIKITMGGVEQIVNGATSVPNQTHVIVDVVGFVY